jgi:hypothetical protein
MNRKVSYWTRARCLGAFSKPFTIEEQPNE